MAYDIDLEPERTTGPRFPTLKLREPGQQWVGMLIDYDPKAPLFEYDSNERKLGPDGTPKTKDVVTVLILPRTNCPVVMPRDEGQEEGVEVDAPIGTVARFHIQGHNRWDRNRNTTFRAVKDKHGRFQLGDVIRCSFAETTRLGTGGRRLTQDKKLLEFEMRKPRPDESTYVDQCFAEYQKFKAVDLEDDQPTATNQRPTSQPVDEEPW